MNTEKRLNQLSAQIEANRLWAGIASPKQRAKLLRANRAMHEECMMLNPIPSELEGMSDEQLVALLEQ